ncbi:type II secretion system F family protein [Trinickia dinghuensis]|uniref:Type II secretion system F family protein n=1 Tax=Trinickia dinghuensis TaxID=2291023 RepID=A0A3D8K4A1_9BURK|nr:type II secretion system F family protein [Trinickia dinghuensis]RDU99695.1 type II secretion system F family protein [Trinickia dinghuensis]
MNTANLWTNLALVALLAGATLWLLLHGRSTRARIAQRVRLGAARASATGHERNVPQQLAHKVATIGERMPIIDAAERGKLATRLASAGFRESRAVSILAGLKIVCGACVAFGAIALAPHLPRIGGYFVFRLLAMAGAFVIGMMLPEYALGYAIKRRQRAISAALPDALDLLVICTNAGNSLVVAIKRVAAELHTICPPLSDEFSVTADELQIGSDSAVALNAMATRIGLVSMRALVTTLVQSQQYGTPITQSLRMLSRTERSMQIIALEEKAAKLAPKMTLPMMLFIMPTVALIAAGPAIIRLIAVFHHH